MTDRDRLNAKYAEARLNEALEGLAEPFTSKAAQQRVLENLNRSYSYLRDRHRGEVIAAAPREMGEERNAHFDKFYLPFDLHQVRDRHAAAAGTYWEAIERLTALRAEAKAKEVTKVERVETEEDRVEKKVRETVSDLIARRVAQYNQAIALHEIFGKLPVTVTPHYVRGHKGTEFIRCFYYLNGKLTALGVILAAAQAIADKEEGR